MQIPSNSNGAAQAGTPNGNSATLTCASCGDENALDSRFCRHCGAVLRQDAPKAPTTPAAPPVAQTVATPPVVTPPVAAPVVHAATTSDALEAAAIDKRRARQLLDRAFGLAERGDVASAILACRQSVALDPEAPQGFSMLGLLLERAGSLEEAAAAYRKVLHLAPESRLEADSLARLQATLTQRKGSSGFHFDEKELFDDTPAATVAVPAVTAATAVAPQVTPPADSPTDALRSAFPSNTFLPGAVPPPATPAVSAVDFGLTSPPPASTWQRLLQRPSFYFRGAPIVASTLLGLAFMLWSRQAVISQQQAVMTVPAGGTTTQTVVENGGTVSTTQPDAQTGTVDAPGVAPNNTTQSGTPAYPIRNRPLSSGGAPATDTSGGNDATSSTTSRTTTPARSVQPNIPAPRPQNRDNRPAPRALPPMSLPPARVLPPAGQSDIELPRNNAPSGPSTPNPAPADNGAVSSGGRPMNPGGTGPRGYIQLRNPRPGSAAPSRAGNQAGDAERSAANEGRAGRNEQAIERITSAIEADGDTGWRYQQRALLFLERGDNQRAADDFQTALNAYRDQIRRGERVAEARAGIRACESGRQLALSNLRR